MKPTFWQIQQLLPTTRQPTMMMRHPKGLARNRKMRRIKVRGESCGGGSPGHRWALLSLISCFVFFNRERRGETEGAALRSVQPGSVGSGGRQRDRSPPREEPQRRGCLAQGARLKLGGVTNDIPCCLHLAGHLVFVVVTSFKMSSLFLPGFE